VLGIASLIICSITMAEITNTKDFMKAIEEVRQEYPEDSIERKIPTGFIVTVAAAETGNFNFKNAPTAKSANNFFGMQASSNYIKDNPDKFMTTTGGANLRTFSDSKDSIRGFLQLITSDDRYKNVRESTENIENMFKGMSPYAERTDYPSFLANVYNDRIKPIIETENMLIPKRKPIVNQMNTLK
jgi:uncharacterized FlgJ-related protein